MPSLDRRSFFLWAVVGLPLLPAVNGWCREEAKALPANYKLIFDNRSVAVVRCRYGPLEKLPLHDHSPTPTVYVYLTDSGPVRFTHVEAHPFSIVRRPLKAGEFRISPGRIEKHAVENLSNTPTEFLRIELKTIPLGTGAIAYRSHATFVDAKSGITNEFDSRLLAVDRVVLERGQSIPCTDGTPGLLVSFSEARLSDGRRLKAGEVAWITPGVTVGAGASGPAHLLRITPK
jgi:hypothetical protein